MKRAFCWMFVLPVFLCPAVLWAQEEKPASALTVEAKACTGVQDRAPAGEATTFPATVGQVYLWTKITGAAGETAIKHVWVHDGKEVATVDLPVKTAAYRTWSAKKIPPSWTGSWEVRVIGPDGAALATVPFTVGE